MEGSQKPKRLSGGGMVIFWDKLKSPHRRIKVSHWLIHLYLSLLTIIASFPWKVVNDTLWEGL